ncbi:alpha/beta hydrolase-fold protein [Lysobacter sp. CFH 32150]|uniref:alpha/beta hydrolase n=1 Tax=Lysobacter sp. CFH 32150 TaxID=2927128 RepID=UPI001FA7BEF9|nr:alpha/beta hydrolase-fold protein [Lysobacter sp. CFH 32150]
MSHSGPKRTVGLLVAVSALLSACVPPGMDRSPHAANPVIDAITVETSMLEAPTVSPQPIRVRIWLPPGYAVATRRYPTLYINDGQDMEAVGLQATLERLYAGKAIQPVIVVAIDMPPDRMGAYGFSDRPNARSLVAGTRYGAVGTHAHAYSEWVAKALVPAIDARYRTRRSPDARAVLGWSLGAANAFNLAWQYPELFGHVGAFSPSFWLSADRNDADAVQRSRLAQRMVDGSHVRADLKLFFAVGTTEETDDRDGDGINDALDDTRDLMDGWHNGGTLHAQGLRQLGYSVNLDYGQHASTDDAVLLSLQGGGHNQVSWARMLPTFFTWAYSKR